MVVIIRGTTQVCSVELKAFEEITIRYDAKLTQARMQVSKPNVELLMQDG